MPSVDEMPPLTIVTPCQLKRQNADLWCVANHVFLGRPMHQGCDSPVSPDRLCVQIVAVRDCQWAIKGGHRNVTCPVALKRTIGSEGGFSGCPGPIAKSRRRAAVQRFFRRERVSTECPTATRSVAAEELRPRDESPINSLALKGNRFERRKPCQSHFRMDCRP